MTCCRSCGKTAVDNCARLKSCGNCKTVSYCSKTCQKNHWKHHKKLCGQLLPPAQAALPSEVIREVMVLLLAAGKEGFETLLKLQQTSYQNYLLGQSLIYCDVVLTYHNVKQFAKMSQRRPANLAIIQSLTIQVTLDRFWSVYISRAFETLASMLQYMTKLKTFSISIHRWHQIAPRITPKFPARIVVRLLRSMPTSVENLEINTNINDCYSANESTTIHLCPIIGSLIPQLTHLHFRRDYICSEVFHNVSSLASSGCVVSKLETIVLTTVDQAWFRGNDGETTSCPELRPAEGLNDWNRRRLGQRRSRVAESGRALVSRGVFPRLNTFKVIGLNMPDENAIGPLTAVIRDCLSNETMAFPYTTNNQSGWLRYIDPESLVIPDGWGSSETIIEWLEGHAWQETIKGSRYPSAFLGSAEALARAYTWNKPSTMLSADQRWLEYGRMDVLGGLEERLGQLVMRPSVTAGLGVKDPLTLVEHLAEPARILMSREDDVGNEVKMAEASVDPEEGTGGQPYSPLAFMRKLGMDDQFAIAAEEYVMSGEDLQGHEGAMSTAQIQQLHVFFAMRDTFRFA